MDSVAGSAQNPLTLNRYLYANADPATLVDPDGHCAKWGMSFSGGSPRTVCVTEDTTFKSAYQAGYSVGTDYGGAVTATESARASNRISGIQTVCKSAWSAGYAVNGCNVGGMSESQLSNMLSLRASGGNAATSDVSDMYNGNYLSAGDAATYSQMVSLAWNQSHHHCDNPLACVGDFANGFVNTVAMPLAIGAGLVALCGGGGIVSGGLVTAACIAAAAGGAAMSVPSLVDYGQDLSNHGFNPFSTASDAMGRLGDQFASGDYYGAGTQVGGGVVTIGGTALMAYGGYKGFRSFSSSGDYYTTPAGSPLSAHYLNETGPVRNIPGSVVDETIRNAPRPDSLGDRTIYYDPVNDVTVVRSNTTGKIMSAHKGKP